MSKDSTTKLIHRLNRIQGQIGAIKKILGSDFEQRAGDTGGVRGITAPAEVE